MSAKDGEPNSTEASYWRIIFSPAGPRHVYYLKSELTERRWRIYSDNIAMARWLQSTVQGMLNAELSDTTISCADAQFSKAGDPRYFWTEHIRSHGEEISLTGSISASRYSSTRSRTRFPTGATACAPCSSQRSALASSATASRRRGDPGRGNVRGGHSRRRRWHSPKAGRKRSEAELPVSLRLLQVSHQPEHVELMRKALHTAGYASRPLFDVCFWHLAVMGNLPDVRFAPDIVAEVQNRTSQKISPKLNFGLLCRCFAFQRHYGGA